MAELLARHATPQTEVALLTIARGKTVQAMRIALREEPNDEDCTRTLSLTVPVEEAYALEATRMMIEHMDGKGSGEHWLGSLLAEGQVSLLDRLEPCENEFSERLEAQDTAWRTETKHLMHLHAEAEQKSRPAVTMRPQPGQAPKVDDLPSGLTALDARIRHYSAELGSKAAEFATRLAGETDRSPPTAEHMEQMQALERSILSGEFLRKVTDTVSDPDSDSVPDSDSDSASDSVPISATPAGNVTLRVRVPDDLLLHYRQLERVHHQELPGTSFVQFLCWTLWRTWVPALGRSDKWESIYRRDRYRCTSPVCHQRSVTLHHVQYRSHGGNDNPENLTSPCPFCHLEGEHGGRLKILPPGSNPTWLLGRPPIIKVHRRERTLLRRTSVQF